MEIYTNIFPYMPMTYKLQQGILIASWIHLKTSISSSLREWDQFHFILGVISSVTVMVFYALPHTNILKIWSRYIWLCLLQIQNHTSMTDILYNKVTIQSLKHQSCWIMRILRNINPLLVPFLGYLIGSIWHVYTCHDNVYLRICTTPRLYRPGEEDICISGYKK